MWVVDIDLVSVWGTEVDLISVSRSELNCFFLWGSKNAWF